MKKKKEKNIQIITNHEKNYLNATNKTKRRKICLLCPYSAEIFVKQKGIFAQARKLIEQVFNVKHTFDVTVVVVLVSGLFGCVHDCARCVLVVVRFVLAVNKKCLLMLLLLYMHRRRAAFVQHFLI